jgi:hypothetical protein
MIQEAEGGLIDTKARVFLSLSTLNVEIDIRLRSADAKIDPWTEQEAAPCEIGGFLRFFSATKSYLRSQLTDRLTRSRL